MIDGHRYTPGPTPTTAPASPPHHSVTASVPRIALAHDWLVGYRGGEAVLDHIARVAQGMGTVAGLYTMFADREGIGSFPPGAPGGGAGVRGIGSVHASFLNRMPGARRFRRWMLPLYPRAVEELSRRLEAEHRRAPIDLLISTSSAAIKGLRPPAGVPHLCYCHTPARYLWSQAGQYATGGGGGLRALGLRVFGAGLREWDRKTAANVTRFMANSTHVQSEIRRCYGRESAVVHPPVRTDFFTPDPSVLREDFWLCAGALEPYKRVDAAIGAARIARKRLVVVGRGSQGASLRRLARGCGADVTFVDDADDAKLRDLYRRAAALLFPQVEDFGIVAAEAQACGTPVAACGAGGALDTVIDGETGVLFRDAARSSLPEALARAAGRCEQMRGASDRCRANAERFGAAVFEHFIRGQISAALGAGAEGGTAQVG